MIGPLVGYIFIVVVVSFSFWLIHKKS